MWGIMWERKSKKKKDKDKETQSNNRVNFLQLLR